MILDDYTWFWFYIDLILFNIWLFPIGISYSHSIHITTDIFSTWYFVHEFSCDDLGFQTENNKVILATNPKTKDFFYSLVEFNGMKSITRSIWDDDIWLLLNLILWKSINRTVCISIYF